MFVLQVPWGFLSDYSAATGENVCHVSKEQGMPSFVGIDADLAYKCWLGFKKAMRRIAMRRMAATIKIPEHVSVQNMQRVGWDLNPTDFGKPELVM